MPLEVSGHFVTPGDLGCPILRVDKLAEEEPGPFVEDSVVQMVLCLTKLHAAGNFMSGVFSAVYILQAHSQQQPTQQPVEKIPSARRLRIVIRASPARVVQNDSCSELLVLLPSLETDSLLTVGTWTRAAGLWVRLGNFWKFDQFENKHFNISSLEVRVDRHTADFPVVFFTVAPPRVCDAQLLLTRPEVETGAPPLRRNSNCAMSHGT